jgi:nitrite reductase/ring-hydroxylating ferredoxin subunit
VQIFYDPSDGQVMAVYESCRYAGSVWQDQGFVEAEAPSIMPRSRDLRVTVVDGQVADWEASPNPEQPTPEVREPTLAELLMEAGVDIKAARQRLLAAR